MEKGARVKMDCALRSLEISFALVMDAAGRSQYKEASKSLRYRNIIGDPHTLKGLSGGQDKANAVPLLKMLGKWGELRFLTVMRYIRTWAVLLYTKISSDAITLYAADWGRD